jgi:hypothetical protein
MVVCHGAQPSPNPNEAQLGLWGPVRRAARRSSKGDGSVHALFNIVRPAGMSAQEPVWIGWG